ncbi:MAG: TIGR04086 family membrane protein [Oscillospiraceae bacterium]|nr:TIGR04086 family membrane protein [Oscillospiraceae bacterium]
MVVNRKVTGTATSMTMGLLIAGAMSLAVTIAGAGVCGYLISKEILTENAIGYCVMIIILLSAATGSAVAVNRIKRRRVFVCGISGLIYFVTLLSMTALFFGGQYQGIGVSGLLVAAGSGAVAILGLRREKAQHKRRRKLTNR